MLGVGDPVRVFGLGCSGSGVTVAALGLRSGCAVRDVRLRVFCLGVQVKELGCSAQGVLRKARGC